MQHREITVNNDSEVEDLCGWLDCHSGPAEQHGVSSTGFKAPRRPEPDELRFRRIQTEPVDIFLFELYWTTAALHSFSERHKTALRADVLTTMC